MDLSAIDPRPQADASDGFRSLFEFLPIAAYQSAPDGTMLRANRALVLLNSLDSEAQLLQAAREAGNEWYIEPQRRELFRRQLAREGLVQGFVSEIRRHGNGEHRWVNENAQVVRDAQGAPLYFEGTIEDITERVLAEQALSASEAQFRQLAEQMPGVVFRVLFDPQGQRHYQYVSQGVQALYGVAAELIMSGADTLSRFRHPEDKDRFEVELRSAVSGGSQRQDEFRIVLDDGTQKWLQLISNTARQDAAGVLRVGLIVDITARKQADELRRQLDRAEMASQAKGQLLSRVSHELRTPLNGVLGFSQLMASDAAISARHRGWAQQIVDSGQHLLGLVDDVLDLSRAHSGQLGAQLADVALLPLIEDTWHMVQASQPQPAVVWRNHVANSPATAAPWVHADARRVKQVLAHLLGNAITYNKPGGEVRVTVHSEGGVVTLQVQDSGMGMDAQQMARLFSPFDRLGAEHSRIAGRGIGLAVSKQVAEAMGGSLTAQSTPGVGSTFTLRLPAVGAAVAAAPPAAALNRAAPP